MKAAGHGGKFAVIGGDLRMLAAAGALREAGFDCAAWGFDAAYDVRVSAVDTMVDSLCCSAAAAAIGELSSELASLLKSAYSGGTVEEALEGCTGVLLPLPAVQQTTVHATSCARVSMPLSAHELTLDALVGLMDKYDIRLLCGGRLEPDCIALCREHGITAFDYYEQEEFAIANAIPTAEGAVAIAINELAITLHGARALVIGYGRIGRVLAKMLQGLGTEVVATARRASDLAWIAANRLEAAETSELGELLCHRRPDVIFNTVPHRVLEQQTLEKIRSGTLIIDLASKPGGVDVAAARELGHKVIWALSLPGKVAPITAGRIIADTVRGFVRRGAGTIC